MTNDLLINLKKYYPKKARRGLLCFANFTALSATILLSACNAPDHSIATLKFKKSYSFKKTYSGQRFAGLTMESNTQKELFYITNAHNGKSISIYELNGSNIREISLKKVIDIGEQIAAVHVFNEQELLVLTQYTNNIYTLSENGDILNKVHISDSSVIGKFETQPSLMNGAFLFKNTLIFFPEIPFPNNPNLSRDDAYKTANSNRQKQPYLIQVKNYLTHPQVKYGVYNFYDSFIPHGYLNIEPPMFSATQDFVFIFSMYSDQLYVVDDQLTTLKKIKLKSKYTPIGAKPLLIGADKYDSLNSLAQTCGMIYNVCYNKYTQTYLVSVRHQTRSNATRKEKGEFSAWSIISLDKKLNYLSETQVKQTEYLPGEIFPTKDGIMLYKIPKKLNDITTFDVYEISN